MDKMKVMIADDEAFAREELKHILSEIEEVSFEGEAKNGLEAIKLVDEKACDLLLLDIEMPGLNGIEVARKLLKKNNPPKIIFATAYDHYAVEAFEVNAIDYILKPFDEDRIKKGIVRVLSLEPKDVAGKLEKMLLSFEKREKYLSKVCVKTKGNIHLVDINDIVYAKGEGGLVFICENGKEYLSDYKSLESLEEKLDPQKFYKTHRAYLVNIDKMKEIIPQGGGNYTIRCKTSSDQFVDLPLSRRQAKDLKKKYRF